MFTSAILLPLQEFMFEIGPVMDGFPLYMQVVYCLQESAVRENNRIIGLEHEPSYVLAPSAVVWASSKDPKTFGKDIRVCYAKLSCHVPPTRETGH
jgi:hypothetical protein